MMIFPSSVMSDSSYHSQFTKSLQANILHYILSVPFPRVTGPLRRDSGVSWYCKMTISHLTVQEVAQGS